MLRCVIDSLWADRRIHRRWVSHHVPDHIEVERRTRRWLEDVVLGLRLCPFAVPYHKSNQIFITTIDASDQNVALERLRDRYKALQGSMEIATELVVFPYVSEFDNFFEFSHIIANIQEELTRGKEESEELIQMVAFHPRWLTREAHESGKSDDFALFTNRSPYPLVHLLRQVHVDQALEV